MGIRSVAVHSTVDRNSAHVTAAAAAVELPDASAADTYLRGDLIIAPAKAQGAEAVIPGYGFLTENADFAEACAAPGLISVGPTPAQMRDFGLKHAARALAEKAGVPLTPGTGLLGSLGEARAAEHLGCPVMLKSTVGIGGVYTCIYGMDSPGGYQLVGRTLPIWNKFLKNDVFTHGEPWLLRFVDQVRFEEVSEAELDRLHDDFREAHATIRIDEEIFDLGAHDAFMAGQADSIAAFKARQVVTFEQEVARWKEEDVQPAAEAMDALAEVEIDGQKVAADIHGSVWKVLIEEGQSVEAGDAVMILEAMKTELRISAPVSGTIRSIRCRQGRPVTAGETLLVMEG
jgi:acetyl/propionyl-CoA carboxylase alpha subunit